MTSTTAPGRVPRRRSETRQRLLDAARELLFGEGAGSVRVESVCQRAGYTRGAFYSNFESVDQLLLALYAEHADQLISTLDQTIEETLSDPAALSTEDAVAAIVATLPFEREWFGIRIRLAAEASRDEGAAVLLQRHEQALCDRLEPVLLRAVARVGRVPTVDPGTFTRAVVAARDGALAADLVDLGRQALRTVVIRAVVVGLTAPSAAR